MVGSSSSDGEQRVDRCIGIKLKELRAEKGCSFQQVADALGLPPKEYVEVEAGVRRFAAEHLVRAAQFFERDIEWFFEGLAGIEAQSGESGQPIDLIRERDRRGRGR